MGEGGKQRYLTCLNGRINLGNFLEIQNIPWVQNKSSWASGYYSFKFHYCSIEVAMVLAFLGQCKLQEIITQWMGGSKHGPLCLQRDTQDYLYAASGSIYKNRSQIPTTWDLRLELCSDPFLLVEWGQESYLTFLYLSFLIWKKMTVWVVPSHSVFMSIRWDNAYEALEYCLVYSNFSINLRCQHYKSIERKLKTYKGKCTLLQIFTKNPLK